MASERKAMQLRLEPELMAALDARRGTTPRERYVRELLWGHVGGVPALSGRDVNGKARASAEIKRDVKPIPKMASK